MKRLYILTILLLLISLCGPLTLDAQSWVKELPDIGTFSSPRVADLNGDGVGDIIMGAGRAEFMHCDSAMIALDGLSGELMWKVPAEDQIFGSAALEDITGDGVVDVFIGGRSAELKAINGATGELIWEFIPGNSTDKARKAGWFNFYNAQFIPDQNDDGVRDVIISNGGDVLAEPYDADRPAGSLLVISAADGKVLAKAEMPDGKEIYMSVAVVEQAGEHQVIFGTGGETIGGNLFVGTLESVMREDLSDAKKLATGLEKGFISPPVWADITGDGIHEVIALSVDGRMMTFDGKDHRPLWTANMPNTESYSSMAVGFFTADSIPDFFISIAAGKWPKLEWNRQFMINGQNGVIEYADSLGFYQTSTAAVADMSGDGRDEVLLSVNYQVFNELYQKYFQNTLIAIDFTNPSPITIGKPFVGNNISSSPWLGDLDGNGRMDIIYCHGTNERHTYTFDGLQIHRLATDIPIYRPVRWGAYMGSDYNGVFAP